MKKWDCISSSCSLFADDCLLYRKIETDDDHRALQQDLYNVEMWARKWLMTFNVDKCEVVQISLKPQSKTSYIFYNSKLKQVIDAKYPGVIIDSKLSFNKNIDMSCKKADSTLSFLRRNLYHCQRNVKIDVYHTYVCKTHPIHCDSMGPTLRKD